jgi:hypothetical protein
LKIFKEYRNSRIYGRMMMWNLDECRFFMYRIDTSAHSPQGRSFLKEKSMHGILLRGTLPSTGEEGEYPQWYLMDDRQKKQNLADPPECYLEA